MIERIRTVTPDLIVVDESSNDGTAEIAARMGVRVYQREGRGKGFGVQKALAAAEELGYDVLVLIDCDLTYPPERIPDLIRHMDGLDMVVGSRDFTNIPVFRRLVNYLHTGLINVLYRARLRDINSGLRALRVAAFRGMIDAADFDVEAQITVRALKRGLRIREIPVSYLRRHGYSKIRAWHTWTICRTIVRERFHR